MNSKLHLSYILLFVSVLELPSVVMGEDEGVDSYEIRRDALEIRCKLQPNSWNCFRNRTNLHRFYYDITMQSCKTYQYGGCDLNVNSFTSLADCSSSCKSDDGTHALSAKKMTELSMALVCSLQYEFGTCSNYYPLYYFDVSTRSCKGFSYSGCGGNRNRFAQSHECMDVCGTAVPEYMLQRKKKV